MKRQPIPQAEFGFAGDSFALVAEKAQPTPSNAPTILAEMTPEERERVREQSKAAASLHNYLHGPEIKTDPRAGLTFDGEQSHEEPETTPGLAPGSYWSNPMAKALATMQK